MSHAETSNAVAPVSKFERSQKALKFLRERTAQHDLSVSELPVTRQFRAHNQVRIAGRRCSFRTITNIQRENNQRRMYAKVTESSLAGIDTVIFVLLPGDQKPRFLVVPSEKLKEAVGFGRAQMDITFPLHERQGRARPRLFDWLQYEDAWSFFTAPQQ